MEENIKETPIQPQTKSNNMLVFGVVALLAVLSIGFAVVSRENKNTDSEVIQETAQKEETKKAQVSATVSGEVSMEDSLKTVEIEAGAFYFKPNVINVKKGDKVRIVMTSKDMMHDFIIDELNVKLPITKSGETKTVEFTADTAGEFEFYCSVGQHRKNGQTGTLIVE